MIGAVIMTEYLSIHPDKPQVRLIQLAASVVKDGGVIAYPTDSCYALGCGISDKAALQRVKRIRGLDKHHNFTLLCKDLSEIATYAKVHNSSFRLMKSVTPGPYTFLMKATSVVPKKLQHPKRRTIGIRVPDNRIVLDMLAALGDSMFNTSLILPGDDLPVTDPREIEARLRGRIDLIIDGGNGLLGATTVVDLADGQAVLLRQGMGDISVLGI